MTLSETIELIEKAMEGVTHPDAPAWIAVAQDGNGPNGGFWTCAAATTDSPRYIRADLVHKIQEELALARSVHRWNVDRYGENLAVCRNEHDKGDPCDWETFVPLARAEAAAREAEAMKREIAELREQMGYWQRGHERIQECLDDCVKADPLDAPIPLVGVEAKRWHAYRAEAFRHALEMMGIPEEFRARALLSKESADADR